MKFALSAALLSAAVTVSAKTVSLTASHSASPIHFQPLNAHESGIWIGEPTSSYCPANIPGCKTVDGTAFLIDDKTGAAYMYTAVPGGQLVYVGEDGAVQYTVPHTQDMGKNGTQATVKIEKLNESVNKATLDGGDFLACPKSKDAKAWKVFSAAAKNIKPPTGNKDDCLGFTALAGEVGEKALAYQYE